jgi:hypothetical protein
LEQRRREIGEIEFSRQMLLRPVSDATSRFKADWVERAFQNARDMGAVLVETYSGPCRTFTGVDLGVGQGLQHDESAIFTIMLLPDGRRQVLNIEAGRWQAPELVEKLKSTAQRYGSRLRVESNAAQMLISDSYFCRVTTVTFAGRGRPDGTCKCVESGASPDPHGNRRAGQALEAETHGKQDDGSRSGSGGDERPQRAEVAGRPPAVGEKATSALAYLA